MTTNVIYVLSVAKKATGGTELLHQLVYEINRQGGLAKIVYVDKKGEIEKTPKAFQKYVNNNDIAEEVEDIPDNIVVVPEILFSEARKYQKCQKLYWWLSVDNYYFVNGFMNHVKHKGWLRAMKHVLVDGKRYPRINICNLIGIHLYQSEYAHQFLLKNGVKEENTRYLSDYINDEFLNVKNDMKTNRNDVVLYNPAKGWEFTKKIIDACPNVVWKPLCNMTPAEVHETLLTSKLYIDFGNHPGKDRFPREAAISGCCVITGKRGAAANPKDIPIPQKYKFDENSVEINDIVAKIYACISDYNQLQNDFEPYREMIRGEKAEFSRCVKDIFLCSM